MNRLTSPSRSLNSLSGACGPKNDSCAAISRSAPSIAAKAVLKLSSRLPNSSIEAIVERARSAVKAYWA